MVNDIATLMAYTESMAEGDRKLVSSLGKQVTLWCFDCDKDRIDDANLLSTKMMDYIDNTNLSVREKCISKYEPQGITIALILEESHLMVNTWPEHRVLQIEVFACTDINQKELESIATKTFGAKRVYVYKYE
ncbi:MAG: S-adenosylmethionine decarboxylase family protein [Candidatus Azotimanducaceae bacterium]|uniref:Adenosylmethionine decarboxylase n=1 Tax=OM182 bacterium TaxID=2510334 RepID=A0A520S4S4_9GAMM|nr:hypothetical protein [Gammaproteobacteria bacterium]OUV68304.1 MAG: hypothetical protein CBC93_02965 [Gammaproteobacteria bacterium TMED133]RZO77478.1 MAG: hypothetical protein EVA68_01095 [OM182 bacterium]